MKSTGRVRTQNKVRLAEARRANAETQLSAAQAALDHLTFECAIYRYDSQGQYSQRRMVIAGQQILTLATGSSANRTTDLSERDIPLVQIDQPVTVLVKALNQVVMGRVSAISPLADTLGGDVVTKQRSSWIRYPRVCAPG